MGTSLPSTGLGDEGDEGDADAPIMAKRKSKAVQELEEEKQQRKRRRATAVQRKKRNEVGLNKPSETNVVYEKDLRKIATRGVVAHALSEKLGERMHSARELQRRLERTLRTEEYGSEPGWNEKYGTPEAARAQQAPSGRRASLNTARAQLRYSTAGVAVGAYDTFDPEESISNGGAGRRRAQTLA